MTLDERGSVAMLLLGSRNTALVDESGTLVAKRAAISLKCNRGEGQESFYVDIMF